MQLGLVKDQGSNAMLSFTFLLAWVTHSLKGVLKDTYTFVISFPFISFHFSWPVSDTSLLLSEPLKLIASVYKGLFGDFQVCRCYFWVITQCQVAAVTGKRQLRSWFYFLCVALREICFEDCCGLTLHQ